MTNEISRFRQVVRHYYRTNGRHDLPWRKTKDLYRILVSEVMLQQTQVDRVIPFYKKFIKQFPTAKKLAAAPLSDVLVTWQGLGYNRRAKMLHGAAKVLSEIPRSNPSARFLRFDLGISDLEKLPGVGPYTARAVAAFAENQDVIVIETNIRTVVIHHFFPKKKKVSDVEIEKVLRLALPKGKSREWYSALMDYGAYLKRSGISHNAKSNGYAKQSKFKGSFREARGAILRALAEENASSSHLINLLGAERRPQMKEALEALFSEGMIRKEKRRYLLGNRPIE